MHVAACAVFEGPAPAHDELVEAIVSRLHLVPRYRQRLAFVPFEQGRPVWVDDPHFNAGLPRPPHRAPAPRAATTSSSGSPDACSPRRSTARSRCGSCGSSRGSTDGRFALLSKTHHALVDGVSGVDIATVLFDSSPDPMPVAPPEHEWVPRPLPTGRPAARRRAARARHGPGGDRPRRPRRAPRARGRWPTASARRSSASARWRGPG